MIKPIPQRVGKYIIIQYNTLRIRLIITDA